MRPDTGMEINAAGRLGEALHRLAYCRSLAKTDRNELLPRECHGRIVEIMLHRDDRINFALPFAFPCLREDAQIPDELVSKMQSRLIIINLRNRCGRYRGIFHFSIARSFFSQLLFSSERAVLRCKNFNSN